MKNIIFIGGIHGSGKGRICEDIKQYSDSIHLTASDVLKWEEISSGEEKLVKNIDETQDRLITNLNTIIEINKRYLLDGHYCLLNKIGIPERIPINTFKKILPLKLILVITEPKIIKERLQNRDSKHYDENFIKEFQDIEIEYAEELSAYLNIPLMVINSTSYNLEKLITFIK